MELLISESDPSFEKCLSKIFIISVSMLALFDCPLVVYVETTLKRMMKNFFMLLFLFEITKKHDA
jgi:hypothetical protein